MKRFITAGLALAVGLTPTILNTSDFYALPSFRTRIVKHKQSKSKPIVQLSSRSSSLLDSEWQPCKLTWYSSEQGVGNGLITATGTYVHNNSTIAVDPHVIPLGSTVEIRFMNGTVRTYHAVDTGGAIKGRHIDIFNNNNNYCIQKGVQMGWFRVLHKAG